MTSSSSSGQNRLRLILIHGMNNNQQCFFPLRDAFSERGFDVKMMVLPNHGETRDEVKELESALGIFDQEITPLVKDPYVVVAFSQGAQYFQLWLNRYRKPAPRKQVLLAPAVFINFHSVIEKLVHLLPATHVFRSKMPQIFRRYNELYYWEYRLLFSGVHAFGRIPPSSHVPTLILIDPKDELVNAKKVMDHFRKAGATVSTIERKNLKWALGRHHIIFHPDYFSPEEWKSLIDQVTLFLNAGA